MKVGNTVYVAGQGPLDVQSGVEPEGVAGQTNQVLTNIKNILEAVGASMDEVVKVTVHLQDLSDFQEFNKVYLEFFSTPYPVRTTVQSGLNNILVEIDVVAVISEY
ncbi:MULTISPECIES: RidA family protein [unclassified Bacillus (in: firmicutes)]|uniref:RidA family protein n=1 Tax=unclassified Bacillus (in: firmicutes) TaxID=185979 RepID=UPI0020D27160|nr:MULTISPECIES: Rid family hydrolase [unclassified Bacillus (in: firmicutes)]